MANLFLVEDSRQVKDLLNMGTKNRDKWIALGPSAMWVLGQAGIPYSIPEDFYPSGELEEICVRLHERIELMCNLLDEKIYIEHPELKKQGIHPFLFNFFPLTMLFDTVVSRIFQLQAVLNAYPGYKISIHKARDYPWSIHNITFSNKETIWAHLLSLEGWNREIRFLEQPKEKSKSVIFRIIKPAIRRGLNGMKWVMNTIGRQGEDCLLLHGARYEWECLLPALKEKGYRVLFSDDKIFNLKRKSGKKKLNLEALFDGMGDIINIFEFKGISFYPLLKKRISWILECAVGLCGPVFSKMEELVKRHRIKAVLIAVSSSFVSHVATQAARYFCIPVIVWQHGFMSHKNGRITQLNDFHNMMTSNLVLTFGEEVTKAHLLHVDKFPTRVISVGAVSIDKLRSSVAVLKEAFRNEILYVTTKYYQNMWYYGLHRSFNDRFLFEDQLAILRFLKECVSKYKANVTVKLSPAPLYHDPPCVQNFSHVFRIVKNSPSFKELLPENHIIIIDMPTTTLLQAVATKKPIFVLMRHVGFADSSRKMLEKRVFCADDTGELINAIRRYLEDRIYPADINNDEYLKSHGTYLNDNRSGERAVAVISEIIGKNQGTGLWKN